MERCVFCQGELDSSRRFCRGCGQMQPVPPMPTAPVQAAPAVTQRLRRCPTCQGPVFLEDRFCATCASPLRQPCPSCGTAAPILGRFCPGCSRPVTFALGQPGASGPLPDVPLPTPALTASRPTLTSTPLDLLDSPTLPGHAEAEETITLTQPQAGQELADDAETVTLPRPLAPHQDEPAASPQPEPVNEADEPATSPQPEPVDEAVTISSTQPGRRKKGTPTMPPSQGKGPKGGRQKKPAP